METPPVYHDGSGNPLSSNPTEAFRATELLLKSLEAFHWRTDFVRFCELLELTSDSYAEQKYAEFQELISCLNKFDVEALAKMVTAGGGNL